MDWQSACCQGFTITGNQSFIPGYYDDDQGKWVSVSRAAAETGIDRTSIIQRIKDGGLYGLKVNGRWIIRLSSYQKLVETYRYGKLKTNTGSWWTKEEKETLNSKLSHKEVAKKLKRSYNSVKVMRCKIKKTT